MEYHRRRERRRRGQANNSCPALLSPQNSKSGSLASKFYRFLVLSSLVAIVYMIVDYHCQNCGSKYDMYHLTENIEHINTNLSSMKNSYDDLEMKILKFSNEIPKIEGKIEVLEALANSLENQDFISNSNNRRPKSVSRDLSTNSSIPNASLYLKKSSAGNNQNVQAFQN